MLRKKVLFKVILGVYLYLWIVINNKIIKFLKMKALNSSVLFFFLFGNFILALYVTLCKCEKLQIEIFYGLILLIYKSDSLIAVCNYLKRNVYNSQYQLSFS